MKRVFVALTACLAAAFAVDLSAQPPEGGQDRPRGERREGDRGDRPDGQRGDRRDGDRGGRFGGPGGPGGFRMPPNPVVAAIDADGNGELSEEEIKNASKALMALDKNNDKKITAEEMRPQFGPGGPGGPGGPFGDPNAFINRILENDADKDGKVSKEEAPERMREGFDRMDTNKDGFIDRAELEEMGRRFRGGPGGPGGRPGRDDGDRPNRDNARPATDRPVTNDDL